MDDKSNRKLDDEMKEPTGNNYFESPSGAKHYEIFLKRKLTDLSVG